VVVPAGNQRVTCTVDVLARGKRTGGTLFKAFTFDYAKVLNNVPTISPEFEKRWATFKLRTLREN
jgi:hypothetical protein